MNNLADILLYLLQRYPRPAHLSNARVTKMVYLADWKHTCDERRRLTDISWFFDNFGPFVWAIKDTMTEHDELFQVGPGVTAFGSRKTQFALTELGKVQPAKLPPGAVEVLDHVISATSDLSFDKFIRLVYSTFPVVSTDRYEPLDLEACADEYRRVMSPS